MAKLGRSLSFSLLAAGLLATGCGDGASVLDTGATVDPSGQWSVTQTFEVQQCVGATDSEVGPDGLADLHGQPPPEAFDAAIRLDSNGRLEIIRRSALSELGDDPSLLTGGSLACEVLFDGRLDGDHASSFSLERNTTADQGFCDVEWTRTTELTFSDTSFAGVTESVTTNCDRSCTTRTFWQATRCDACAPIADCTTPDYVWGPRRRY